MTLSADASTTVTDFGGPGRTTRQIQKEITNGND